MYKIQSLTDRQITILVNSCDKYEDVWEPFFKMFSMHWPNCPYDIVLNTETKQFQCDYLNVKTINERTDTLSESNNETIDWSTRLLNVLQQIDTEFVISILDDEFLCAPVDEIKLEQLVRLFKKNKNIASVLLTSPGSIRSKRYKDFHVIKRTKTTQHSANAALYRTKKLISYIKPGENPWQFESMSRTRRGLFDLCYSYQEGKSPVQVVNVFDVDLGVGLRQGKWLWNSKKYLEQYGVIINTDSRGVFAQEDFNDQLVKTHIRKKQEYKQLPLRKKIRRKFHLIKTSLPPEVRTTLSKIKRLGRKS